MTESASVTLFSNLLFPRRKCKGVTLMKNRFGPHRLAIAVAHASLTTDKVDSFNIRSYSELDAPLVIIKRKETESRNKKRTRKSHLNLNPKKEKTTYQIQNKKYKNRRK
jgi:hypothetical protein